MKLFIKTVLAISILALGLTSCNDHDSDGGHDDHNDHQQPILSIDYPAAYVVNGGSANLSVVRLADRTVTETIGLHGAAWPHHVYLSPDKKWLAVAITGADLSGGHGDDHGGASAGLSIRIIDAVTGVMAKELPMAKMPHNAIFNNDGSELWVGQPDSPASYVWVYNTSNWTVKQSIPVGIDVSEITFSSDGTKAYAANTGGSSVTIINTLSKAVIKTVAVQQDPVGAWAASNGMMYVDNETSKSISEISVMADSVVATFSLGFKPGYAAYHASSQELWVSDAENGKVVYYKKNGGAWQKIGETITGTDAHAIAFKADGSLAYVTNQGANTISVIETANKMVIKNIPSGLKPNGITLKE